MVQKLMIANGAVFILQMLMPGLTLYCAISPAAFFQGMIWQPFTCS
jgi:hypothetical protein